jgi:hypothetical protein
MAQQKDADARRADADGSRGCIERPGPLGHSIQKARPEDRARAGISLTEAGALPPRGPNTC